MITGKDISDTALGLLHDAEREFGRFDWDATFADYLEMVMDDPSVSRLSHKMVYDAIVAQGVDESPSGDPIYRLFANEMFGLDDTLARIVQHFESSSRRLEIRKRILLFVGPPAGGKSSVVALIKQALESHTRTDEGAVYAIKGCPMQEEPLHLIPHQLRPRLLRKHGVYIEGDLCPRCRYRVRTLYQGKISDVPVTRVVFSEQEAVGIGYYLATNPNPTDASLLVGSMDPSQLQGERHEVAGKTYRMDGELNVANRGIMEFVEIFKGDFHLLTTLLSLAQEQLIKLERFGSVYADEALIAHSNEGDYNSFLTNESSEALRDRIIAIQIPYNLRVDDEVRVYEKMLERSGLTGTHVPPLTLPTMSVFAVLSRLESAPFASGLSLPDKMKLYNDRSSEDHVKQLKRQHVNEGMTGISPRFVMNRLSTAANPQDVTCITPLAALDSLWQGRFENISIDQEERDRYVQILTDTVNDYSERAKKDVQKAFEEDFENTAAGLLLDYLANVTAYCTGGRVFDENTGENREVNEQLLREMERHADVQERSKNNFRHEIFRLFRSWDERELAYHYSSEPRISSAIEKRLFPNDKKLQDTLTEPRREREKVEWARKRRAIFNRLVNQYDYCDRCAEDLLQYVLHVLERRAVIRPLRNEGIEWQWQLSPPSPTPLQMPL